MIVTRNKISTSNLSVRRITMSIKSQIVNKKKRQPWGCRFECFHNGIILIVNCFKIVR